jgi:hypothetical protein
MLNDDFALTLNDIDTLDLLFNTSCSYQEALEKFILFKAKCDTIKEAREYMIIDPDIEFLFKKLDDVQQ